MARAYTHGPDVTCLLRASHSLAYYAMLRPTEYMLTPLHNTFNKTRHRRACDVTFYRNGRYLPKTSSVTPGKNTVACPVAAM